MQGIVQEDPEMSFRRGYEHGAIETFQSIQRFLDPGTREVCEHGSRKMFTCGGPTPYSAIPRFGG